MASQPYRTSNDLVLRVLKKVGDLAVGQSVQPESFEAVNAELDSIFRRLTALEIVYISDPVNIPGEWFEDLASIVAGEVAVDFGADVAGLKALGLGGAPSNVKLGAGSAAQSLKIITRARPTGEPQVTESF